MTDVEVEYCVPCGHLDRALDVSEAILAEYGQRVDGVRLETGDGGVFVVRADGDVVFDKADEAYDVDEIVSRVEAYV